MKTPLNPVATAAAAATTDLQTAAQLCHALVLANRIDPAAVDALCCGSLGADSAELLDASDARRRAP